MLNKLKKSPYSQIVFYRCCKLDQILRAYRADFYRMYTLDTCRECRVTFKNCIPGMKIVHGNVMSTSFSYCYLKMAVKTCLFLTMLIEVVAKTVVCWPSTGKLIYCHSMGIHTAVMMVSCSSKRINMNVNNLITNNCSPLKLTQLNVAITINKTQETQK